MSKPLIPWVFGPHFLTWSVLAQPHSNSLRPCQPISLGRCSVSQRHRGRPVGEVRGGPLPALGARASPADVQHELADSLACMPGFLLWDSHRVLCPQRYLLTPDPACSPAVWGDSQQTNDTLNFLYLTHPFHVIS